MSSVPATHNPAETDNVERPLKVLVVGGGIGGLSAAIFLRRAGHAVEIFESSRFATETGAAIHIPPNANGLLRRMGMVPEDHGANQCEWISEYRPSGEQVVLKDVRVLSRAFPYPWQLIHRVDLHNALRDLATSSKGEGMPAILNLRSRVVEVNPETSSLTLEDGSIHTGDLIIGADGIHSRALLRKASPEGINLWKLLDHSELGRENWTHGRIALMGDAAHAFLPHQGQGGAQAIEDAAALGALLPYGTRASDISRRLELYVQARYDRATMVQEFTRQAAFKTSRGKHGGQVLDPMQFTQANFTHDAFDNAHGLLLRDMIRLSTYRRMPLSFGPIPSPRQDLRGKARPMGKYSHKTSYMTFKTHKSYLDTLLPSDDFKINTAGSWATATFSISKLGNLTWLGRKGYSFFGLYIHDVVHTTKHRSSAGISEESELKGDFLPVLFENMADPIITGREEINFPKLFATLDERSTSASSFHLSAGWEGTEFCQLVLENLVDAADAEAVLQTSVLTSKLGGPAADTGAVSRVECFSSPALPSQEGERRWKAEKAEIRFTELKGSEFEEAFPTLANVIKGLRDIEVVEVLSAGVQASS
ncbi:hypothetical protein JHW43_004923 [Diplocarpon mali]|nr:hypothetical protein JHW43_004923 [Diplocarpon mali]